MDEVIFWCMFDGNRRDQDAWKHTCLFIWLSLLARPCGTKRRTSFIRLLVATYLDQSSNTRTGPNTNIHTNHLTFLKRFKECLLFLAEWRRVVFLVCQVVPVGKVVALKRRANGWCPRRSDFLTIQGAKVVSV